MTLTGAAPAENPSRRALQAHFGRFAPTVAGGSVSHSGAFVLRAGGAVHSATVGICDALLLARIPRAGQDALFAICGARRLFYGRQLHL